MESQGDSESIGTDLERRKLAAWMAADPILGHDGNLVRLDCDGRVILWSAYGELSDFGWEIDHIRPTVIGGPDVLWNLRARHWKGNRSAGGLLGGKR